MSHPGALKRLKERAREERRSAKEAEREQRRRDKKERAERGDLPEGEDPDIAGIVPGPQPIPEE